jgi:hypothetical protein
LVRFIYITRGDWLHEKVSNPKALFVVAVTSTFLVFLVCASPVIVTAILLGKPTEAGS